MFVGPSIDRRLWNLFCDIAVENAISELSVKSTVVKKEADASYEIPMLAKKSGGLTAEKLYRYLLDSNLSESRLCELETLFLYDDHSVWYEQDDNEGNDGGSEQDNQEHTDSSNGDNENSEQDDSESKQSDSASTSSSTSISQEWKDISERMQQDLETFSRQQGDMAGNMMQNLREVNREKYDYTAFLKKFAVHTEVMKINDDEFDYIFYTYGLNLYKKCRLLNHLNIKMLSVYANL